MKRVLICLTLVFSLLLAPMVHAAGACADGGCIIADFSKKSDDGKAADAGHHCCHLAADRTFPKAIASIYVIKTAAIVSKQPTLASFISGPLLEPPSFA